MKFYIEKIIVTGREKKDSIIELSDGVNIIYGPSNTGKTYIVKCIDYMFGSDKEPFDTLIGYENIKIIVQTLGGTITMTRTIGENKIEVSSTDEKINSGIYSSKTDRRKYNKTINHVWLSLIGIDELHTIVSNENYKRQVLSWRTFRHMFMLTETKIISECSAILSERETQNTAVLSSLIFLLNGNDFSDVEMKDSKEIKAAKKYAVKTYINKELFKLSERAQELREQLEQSRNVEIEQEIETIMLQISQFEIALNNAIEENQKILASLHKKNEVLAECNILINRYNELSTQYDSDLKRLNFVVDGQLNISENVPIQCPLCSGEVIMEREHDYVIAAKAEYKRIKLQSKDLEEAICELNIEKDNIEREIEECKLKKISTEELIEKEINPQLKNLKEKLLVYKEFIECKKEIDVLRKISIQKSADLIDNERDDEDTFKFRAREHIDYSFVETMQTELKLFLENCKYNNLLGVAFDKKEMDIIINGKKKRTNGKGYNAYLNSAVAIVLARYMITNAKYSPDFLVMDSPILSLKETVGKKPTESMKSALFENIVENKYEMQTIIIENEIPDINYKNANIIHFTKEKNTGRYGFLIDVCD